MYCASLVLAASMVVGQADGEEVFKSWVDMSLGSTWSTTVDGATSTMSYRRTLGGKFVQANLNSDGTRVKFLVGIDPATKQCTWWGYDEDGCVVKWVMTKPSKDVWMSEGVGMGPEGKCALKEKLTRIDENTVKEEIEHFMINGKERKAVTTIWKREAKKE